MNELIVIHTRQNKCQLYILIFDVSFHVAEWHFDNVTFCFLGLTTYTYIGLTNQTVAEL